MKRRCKKDSSSVGGEYSKGVEGVRRQDMWRHKMVENSSFLRFFYQKIALVTGARVDTSRMSEVQSPRTISFSRPSSAMAVSAARMIDEINPKTQNDRKKLYTRAARVWIS